MSLRQVSASSRIAAIVRAAVSGSAVVAACRAFQARVPILFRDVQAASPRADDDEVLRVLDESAIARATMALLNRIDRTVQSSSAGRAASAAGARMSAAPVAVRIRLTALTLFSAVVVHLLLTKFEAPEPIAIARAIWTAVLLMLAIAMAGAEGIAAAWRDKSTHGSGNESEIE